MKENKKTNDVDVTIFVEGLSGGSGVTRRMLSLAEYFHKKSLTIEVLHLLPCGHDNFFTNFS